MKRHIVRVRGRDFLRCEVAKERLALGHPFESILDCPELELAIGRSRRRR
jgi:hypothetical protein